MVQNADFMKQSIERALSGADRLKKCLLEELI
jgi:hypothetical protein